MLVARDAIVSGLPSSVTIFVTFSAHLKWLFVDFSTWKFLVDEDFLVTFTAPALHCKFRFEWISGSIVRFQIFLIIRYFRRACVLLHALIAISLASTSATMSLSLLSARSATLRISFLMSPSTIPESKTSLMTLDV